MNLRISKTSSGITVITEVMPIDSAFVKVNIRAGSRNERQEEHGMAHFLEHMLFKGTTKRTAKEIVEEIEKVGGDINAYTSLEHTSYHAWVLKEHVPLALEIIGDMLSNSSFNPSDIERERNVVLEEIGMSEDDSWDFLDARFSEMVWKDQIIGRPILGKPETISSFTPEKIISFVSRNYTADRMYVVCVGAVDHEFCVSQVESYFNVCSVAKIKESMKPAVYVGGEYIQKRDLAEEHMMLGFNGCAYQSRDFYLTNILASILGDGMSSRLFQEVREKRGLCYSISAHHENFSDNGVLYIASATAKENIMALTSSIVEVVQSLLENIEQREIDKECAKIHAKLIKSQERSYLRALEISKQVMFCGSILCSEKIIDTISAITCEDIVGVAKKIFSSTPTLAILGPPMDHVPTTSELIHALEGFRSM
ncbi:pitrilysin family protein [Candidatus Liberibacter asiaticus]|uniref:M16 family peptidase n=2 Tax=Liberibacter asiaticus TaxID=34021 RepID=C6XEY5_LIBAP|nr:pitrilysin family protein [Candidatus Liberibacter asiaticus]ACT56937.1 M16 family peptidase [Candidatus Liberibacter asiaticus str. psy62]AGH16701.1 M16 family peptidase [Candidatus Liberibacter asiaticus str. gxpsy]ALK07079.1 insulinase family protein [Candidatus Liberibacter asiaticus]ASK52551.1 peptidase M16 [Candidatus Liberibacter asiaticus]AWL13876.1 insulinase family protein [Candidatus Liberibacter asiaticus]